MLKIGVTGGIGSGKTLVCSAISAMGIPVYNSDIESRLIVDSDKEVINLIKNLFGAGIYVDGKLERKKVAELVFANRDLLEKLNNIIHPAVARHFAQWVEQYAHHKMIVQEAAILFESGAYKYLDKIIGVIAPLEIRIERIINRDSTNYSSVQSRMNNQLSEEELIKRCDYIIVNDGVQLVVPQINEILNKISNSQ